MKKISKVIINGVTLEEVLDKHKKWINKEEGGEKAVLNNLGLSHVNLNSVNLSNADLVGTDLTYANLTGANLTN